MKIFLKGKTTKYSVIFIWKIAFETLVICKVKTFFWEEMLLYDCRQVFQHHYAQRFEVPHLLSSRLCSPMFSGCEKKFPVLWNPGSKDSTSHAFNFCSYSINSLANYLFLFNLANFPISRHLFFVIWYSDSKTTEYRILLVFFPKSSFRICNNEILFFVLACYCLQLITQK